MMENGYNFPMSHESICTQKCSCARKDKDLSRGVLLVR